MVIITGRRSTVNHALRELQPIVTLHPFFSFQDFVLQISWTCDIFMFFGKFGVLCFLQTPVFRFALLPYYPWIPDFPSEVICQFEALHLIFLDFVLQVRWNCDCFIEINVWVILESSGIYCHTEYNLKYLSHKLTFSLL